MVVPDGNRQIVGYLEDAKRTKLTIQPTSLEQNSQCRERANYKEGLYHIKQEVLFEITDEGTSPDFLPENYQRITRSQCIADLECITKNMKQKDRDTCMLSGTRHEEMEMAINERGKVFLDACIQPLQQFGGDLCDHNGERNHRRSYQNLNKNSESVPITYNRACSVVSLRECKRVEKVNIKELLKCLTKQNSSSYVIDSYTNYLWNTIKIILFEAKTDEWLCRCFTITIRLEAILQCLSIVQVLYFTGNNGFKCLLNSSESLQQHKGNEWLWRCCTIRFESLAVLPCLSIVLVLNFTGNNSFICLLNSSESLQQHKGNVKVEQEQPTISWYTDNVVIQTAHNDRKFAAATKHAILPGLEQSMPEGKVIFRRPSYTRIIATPTSVPSMHGDYDEPDVGWSGRRGRPRKGLEQSMPEGKGIFGRPSYTRIIATPTSVPSMHGDYDEPDVGWSGRRGRPRKGLEKSIPEGKGIFERPSYTRIIATPTSVPSMHGDYDEPDVGWSGRRGRPRKGFIDEDKEDVKGEGIITNNNQKEEKGCIDKDKEDVKGEGIITNNNQKEEKGFIDKDKEDVKGEGIITNNNQKEEKGCIVENKEEIKGEGVIKKGCIVEVKEDIKGEGVIKKGCIVKNKEDIKGEEVIKKDFKARHWLFFVLILLINLGAVNTGNKECTDDLNLKLQKNANNTTISWHKSGHGIPRVDAAGDIQDSVTFNGKVYPRFQNNVNLGISKAWYIMTIYNMTPDMLNSRYIYHKGKKCQTTRILLFYNFLPPPINVTIGSVTDTSISVLWETYDERQMYLQYKDTSSTNWTSIEIKDTRNQTYIVSGLAPGTKYNLRLYADNGISRSNYSEVPPVETNKKPQLQEPTDHQEPDWKVIVLAVCALIVIALIALIVYCACCKKKHRDVDHENGETEFENICNGVDVIEDAEEEIEKLEGTPKQEYRRLTVSYSC